MKKCLSNRFLVVILTLVCAIIMIPSLKSKAATTQNGWAMVKSNTKVKDSSGNSIGTVYAYEGVTVLSISGSKAKIEYSTSGKPKQGYVDTSSFCHNEVATTCTATVKKSCSTYYAASTNLKAGSLSAGETVVVLYSNGVYDYVEYNTTSGRKRAYVQQTNLDYPSKKNMNELPQDTFVGYKHKVNSTQTVYGGPSKQYAVIGSVNSSDNIRVFDIYKVGNITMLYIRYTANGHNKYGYIVE